jgi:O-antigen/teichoic acid export membrane protein
VTYLARALSVVVSLASVPLTLRYLEQERYGLWLTLNSIIAYLNIADLGLGAGLRNQVAKARGRGRLERTGRLLSTAFVAMLVGGLAVAAAGVTLTWLAPLGRWFHISTVQVESELRSTLTVIALTFAYLLPVRMISSAQDGFQESYLGGLWSIGGSLMSLLALLLVIALRGDMTALALASFLLAQLMGLANVWHFFKRHPEARLSWRRIDLRLLRPLFSLSWQFFVLQIYTAILWQTGNLVIAVRLGANEVVPYAVAFRLTWIPMSLLASIPQALWPAYAEAAARGDWEWTRATYRRTTVLTVLAAGLASVVLSVWGRDFVAWWAGPQAQGSIWMMAGLCLYLVTGHWTNCNAILINAVGRPIVQVASGFLDAALNLGLSLYLLTVWGVAGVAWGMTLANLAVSCWFLAWAVRRVTGHHISPPWRETVILLVGPVLASLLVGLGLARGLPLTWPLLLRIGAGAALMGATYSVLAYLLFPKEWRAVLRRQGQRILGRVSSIY